MSDLVEKYRQKHGNYYKWKFNGGKKIYIPLEVITFPAPDGNSYFCPKINQDLSVDFIIAQFNTPGEYGHTFDDYVKFFCHKKKKKYYLNIN